MCRPNYNIMCRPTYGSSVRNSKLDLSQLTPPSVVDPAAGWVISLFQLPCLFNIKAFPHGNPTNQNWKKMCGSEGTSLSLVLLQCFTVHERKAPHARTESKKCLKPTIIMFENVSNLAQNPQIRDKFVGLGEFDDSMCIGPKLSEKK